MKFLETMQHIKNYVDSFSLHLSHFPALVSPGSTVRNRETVKHQFLKCLLFSECWMPTHQVFIGLLPMSLGMPMIYNQVFSSKVWLDLFWFKTDKLESPLKVAIVLYV